MSHLGRVQVTLYLFSIVHLLLVEPLFANHHHKNKPVQTETLRSQETAPETIDELINNHLPGIVVNTTLLKFNEKLANAYNASIVEQDDCYLLIFRHDTKKQVCDKCKYLLPEIKMVYLDNNFDQISPVKTLLLPTCSPEDARIHILNKRLFLTYNDEPEAHDHYKKRRIFLGELDVNIGMATNIKKLTSHDQFLASIEKNWTPFEYPATSGSLYYIYTISPYTIIKVDDINNGTTTTIPTISTNYVDHIWLKEKWGSIRGGTPARLIDNVYLSFFHSRIYSKPHRSSYYFMGAYIFQAEPPFKILAITPNPISFKDMYSARHRVNNLHVTYPAGFAIEKRGDKCLLHVACGENDTSIRIVSIDKDALLKSMVRVSSKRHSY